MKSNHYTIIISPSDLRPAKKLTLHRSTVIMAVFTGVLLICCGIVGSYKFVEHSNLNAQLEQAKRDISELREANLILMRSKQKERRVREFLGIERSLELPGEPGQGGPETTDETLEDFMSSLPGPLTELARSSQETRNLSVIDEALVVEEDFQELLDYIHELNHDLAVIPTISPVVASNAWISSSYGYRKSPFYRFERISLGIGYFRSRGTPILATGDGTVTFAGRNGALGKAVKIRHNNEFVTLYGHMLEIKVKKRQSVKRGDVIGYMGKTGRSTGYHVHYEVRKNDKTVNPYHYLLNWKDRHLLAEEISLSAER